MAVDEQVINATLDKSLDKTLEAFHSLRDLWEFIGNDSHRLLFAVGILGAAILLRILLMRFVYKPITDNIQQKYPDRDPKTIHMFSGPLQRIPFILALFIVAEYLNLQGSPRLFVYHCIYTLMVIAVFWLLFNMAGQMEGMKKYYPKLFRPQIVHWVSPLLKITLVATAIINILQIWGIQVVGLLAGIGIFGLAFALGAQNLVANFLAGFNIVSENHFQLGDYIIIDGVAEGFVQDIGFRTTKIKNLDMSSVYIPNKTIAERALINTFARSCRRIFWKVTLNHSIQNAQLQRSIEGIKTYLSESGDFLIRDNIPTFLGLSEIKHEGVVFVIDCFTNRNERVLYQTVIHNLAMNARRILSENNITYAHIQQDIYIQEKPL